MVSGTVCASAALALLATLSTDTSFWTVRAALLLMGAGFGQLIGQLIQLVQDTAPAEQLGVATTGVRFFQTLGGALGAAHFGTVLSRVYADRGPGGTTSTIGRLTGHAHQQALDAFVSSTKRGLLVGDRSDAPGGRSGDPAAGPAGTGTGGRECRRIHHAAVSHAAPPMKRNSAGISAPGRYEDGPAHEQGGAVLVRNLRVRRAEPEWSPRAPYAARSAKC
ncbi:hypothetical protein OG978_21565 [Streptomyces sp. NBC_01591]|uniref:hypothetical protein n=1 Tax=Streptomyces sp. NBC_01591 TaxID=2975888 RepID=UPI002DDA8EDA|nr:hypothetical protein [Streptomyces sp. NBC_01591]WSD69738.1 hypothetical protein OG978_21565 [Streptomyces sp. NBC_01591]